MKLKDNRALCGTRKGWMGAVGGLMADEDKIERNRAVGSAGRGRSDRKRDRKQVERDRAEGQREERVTSVRIVQRCESGARGAVGESPDRRREIGYGISIKQTEIPWEKSHPAPLD